MSQKNLSLTEIEEKLTAAGCVAKNWKNRRVYVNKTPNGSPGQYGYCVAGNDVRDMVKNITKRSGEISEILAK